jgi:hypothetical protein
VTASCFATRPCARRFSSWRSRACRESGTRPKLAGFIGISAPRSTLSAPRRELGPLCGAKLTAGTKNRLGTVRQCRRSACRTTSSGLAAGNAGLFADGPYLMKILRDHAARGPRGDPWRAGLLIDNSKKRAARLFPAAPTRAR